MVMTDQPSIVQLSQRVPIRLMLALSAISLFLLLTAAACSRANDPMLQNHIDIGELPTDLGRGFPVASLEGVDNAGTGLDTGDRAPNFRMILDDGGYLELADLQGSPVLLNFWATWCGPCRLEMPEIVAEANRNEDLVVLAINVQEELEQLQPFTEDFQMSIPVVRDSEAELRQLYQVTGMPTSVFIDRDGNISTVWRGILTGPALADFLAEIQ